MVKRFIEIAEKAKGILFADPKLLYKEERHLLNQPFFFEGTNGKGVLLVHGWSSTPYELRRLGKYLNENGYTVLGIQLKGHGSTPKDLEDVKWRDWIKDIEIGYGKLKETCPKAYIAGTSIGANLAAIFAAENAEVAGIVLMAMPHKIKFEKLAVFFTRMMFWVGKKYHKKFYPPTFGASTTITRLISYQTYPIINALETYNIVKEARKNLKKITQPCLIMQSTHDHIVKKDSIDRIYNGINSAVKDKKHISRVYHTFISDIKNEHVFEDISNFLNEN